MKKSILSILFLITITFSAAAQDSGINFSEKFKRENQGNYKIEVHEVRELVMIMLAITETGLGNDDMVYQEGSYYQDVLAHFKPYENEKIIQTFDSLLVSSIYNYIFLTGNAISYDFKGHHLKKSETYDFPATGVANVEITENPITTYKKQLEDFAKKSKFREFYRQHHAFYSAMATEYEENANLGQQWEWLEEKLLYQSE